VGFCQSKTVDCKLKDRVDVVIASPWSGRQHCDASIDAVQAKGCEPPGASARSSSHVRIFKVFQQVKDMTKPGEHLSGVYLSGVSVHVDP
jgi:hypothetical protein